ncbi:TlpA family protein disulfide reductase [Kaarinaea lacus]
MVNYRYPVLFAILITGLLLTPTHAAEPLGYHLNPVQPTTAADFTLKDMDDSSHSLKDYQGKVVMLNFWATWCPPCRHEMPSMEEVYQRYEDQGFAVLAINEWEDADRVFIYTGQLSIPPTFPILFDKLGVVADKYAVKGLPTTVLLNRKGQVVYRAIGGRDFNHPEVDKVIRALLNEK